MRSRAPTYFLCEAGATPESRHHMTTPLHLADLPPLLAFNEGVCYPRRGPSTTHQICSPNLRSLRGHPETPIFLQIRKDAAFEVSASLQFNLQISIVATGVSERDKQIKRSGMILA